MAVLRETIKVTAETDVDAIMSRLRSQCVNSALAPDIAELIVLQVGDLVRQLKEQGKRIAASGSQMEVTRDISGDGYSIRILFQEGVKKSFLQTFFDRLRG